MTRALLILSMSFAIGFALCLVVRAGLHRPYAGAARPAPALAPMEHTHHHDAMEAEPAPAPSAPPASGPGAPAPDAPIPPAPASHPVPAAPAPTAGDGPVVGLPRLGVATGLVNTVCPVCGAEVDASLPTSLYHGHVVGFGCRPNRCKERFDADPERYGPAALANRKAE